MLNEIYDINVDVVQLEIKRAIATRAYDDDEKEFDFGVPLTRFFKVASPEEDYSFTDDVPASKKPKSIEIVHLAQDSDDAVEDVAFDSAEGKSSNEEQLVLKEGETSAVVHLVEDGVENEDEVSLSKEDFSRNSTNATSNKEDSAANKCSSVNRAHFSSFDTADNTSNHLEDQDKENIELHLNQEKVKYKKFTLPEHLPSIELKCDSCKRNSTTSTDIEIRTFLPNRMQQLQGKEYGALTQNKIYSVEQTRQFKFCYFCNKYYSSSSDSRSEWNELWASFIFTAMTSRNEKHDTLKQALPIILPLEIKRM